MTILYFELKEGIITDVTKSVPRKMELGFKYIIQGGDYVEFKKDKGGVRVIRGKGKKIKIDKIVTKDGVYLLTPVYLEMVNKLNMKYRRVYGMLRETLGEDFYLCEDESIAEPFKIYLNLELDIIVKYRFDVIINSRKIQSTDVSLIKSLIDDTLKLDLTELGKLSDKPMMISINPTMIRELSKTINLWKSKMVI